MALNESGPFLMAAFICERVLQEPDGTVSIIRIIDRITVNATPQATGTPGVPPDQMPVVPFTYTLFIGLKSGEARGRQTVKIRLEFPNGIKLPEQHVSVLFEGEDRGVNLIMPTSMQLPMEGLYWFHISLEDEFLTSIPLRVVYNRQGLAL